MYHSGEGEQRFLRSQLKLAHAELERGRTDLARMHELVKDTTAVSSSSIDPSSIYGSGGAYLGGVEAEGVGGWGEGIQAGDTRGWYSPEGRDEREGRGGGLERARARILAAKAQLERAGRPLATASRGLAHHDLSGARTGARRKTIRTRSKSRNRR
eukprot:1188500-Prorocentrum_minimum.AAC.1